MTEIGKLDKIQQILHTTDNLLLGQALLARTHPQPECNIVLHRHMLEQRIILKDKADPALLHWHRAQILPVKQNTARARLLKSGDQPQQSCFARTRRAKQRQ